MGDTITAVYTATITHTTNPDTLQRNITKKMNKQLKEYNKILEKHITTAYTIGIEQAENSIHHYQKEGLTRQAIKNTQLNNADRKELTRISCKLFHTPQIISGVKQKIKTNWLEKLLKDIIDTGQTPNQKVIDYLTKKVFKGSQRTIARITDRIYNIIQNESIKKGNGPREVARKIRDVFQKLSKSESERIARTEIMTARNTSMYQELLNDDTVEYIQWIATEDENTRDSHAEQNGMIIRQGDTFPNGCMYPGDDTADPSEFINCRCTLVPFYPDAGYVPPIGADYWFEEDMVFGGSDELKKRLDNLEINVDYQQGLDKYM